VPLIGGAITVAGCTPLISALLKEITGIQPVSVWLALPIGDSDVCWTGHFDCDAETLFLGCCNNGFSARVGVQLRAFGGIWRVTD
jgi:hypothetical protein